jgi:hypothetical protein
MAIRYQLVFPLILLLLLEFQLNLLSLHFEPLLWVKWAHLVPSHHCLKILPVVIELVHGAPRTH